ncbi:Protein CBR-DEL-2 [Caenorhabditis briggsae]|uniref:Protein CBR-DEL-2 n=1 Tax=Caenorhabditis briggsae TaxID=6238 RepID=A8XX08_CAEBR|nr:Protein CBR-DEL-2 [Caenorhabditis briggsae]CAP37177.2 Protein CBR-DEL-2 [Caenorhabditis briggsae]
MTAEVIDYTRRNLEEAMNHSERRMLFRRSRSEPMTLTNENATMTSRTDPEWNMTVDSISIQSSFAEYQHRRKQRLKKQEAHKTSEIEKLPTKLKFSRSRCTLFFKFLKKSYNFFFHFRNSIFFYFSINLDNFISISTETSDHLEMKGNSDLEDVLQFSDEKVASTLSLTDSDNSSNDITSSQAQEISYEEEMRLFMEKTGHLVTNVFADPFDSDERKSRTEMWVEAASTEKLADGENKNKEQEDLVLENGKISSAEDVFGETFESNENKEETVEDDEEEEDEVTEFEEAVVVSEVAEVSEETGEEVQETVKYEIPPIIHQDTKESLLSSNISTNSLMKSNMNHHLKEALYAESEVDVKDVDRFWDYLYEKELPENGEKMYSINLAGPSTSTSERSLGLALSPIKVKFSGIQTNKVYNPEIVPKEMENELEQDRELDEPLEITDQTVESRFFELETTTKLERNEPVLQKTSVSQTPISHSLVQIVNYEQQPRIRSQSQNGRVSYEKENMVREFSFKMSESLFKDLKVLVVERDRAKEAMAILPAKSMKELSDECNYFQTRYRVRIEQNKEKLDRRIDEIWRKMLKMPIESQEMVDFISVPYSDQLTCNARRNLPEKM